MLSPAFIETQFPIARLSAEAYKERKANNGQTLTRLGKWWGRKPLILVRAVILGLLMPASANPKRDREVFLKILTMDDAGALKRWLRDKRLNDEELHALATPPEWERLQTLRSLRDIAREDRKRARGAARTAAEAELEQASAAMHDYTDALQARCFQRLPYAERVSRCARPEQVTGPDAEAWVEINAHLGTSAASLPDLVQQLGQRRYGRTPRVGDAFCGGGSIPFEAARIGCEALASDLNPVAGLLTWASLNLLGGGPAVQEAVMRVQEAVLKEADAQVIDWGIEHNEDGERADAYLYCVEVKPEGCDYYIPLAPSWLVGEKSQVVCRWHRVPGSDRLAPELARISAAEVKAWKDGRNATVVASRVIDPFDPHHSWSVEALRGTDGLRRWTNADVVPRPGDVFQERLYCIRWVRREIEADGTVRETRRYAAPTEADLAREARVLQLLAERFDRWQAEGCIPSRPIVSGYNTDQPIRERGWTHWHHLYTPRQLLTHGLLAEIAERLARSKAETVGCLLSMGRLANWDSRLCQWMSDSAHECTNYVFSNQALNTLFNYGHRPVSNLQTAWPLFVKKQDCHAHANSVALSDARDLRESCDFWITDPPYADAVNYHELADFFLAWQDRGITELFPGWTPDARAELAVRGSGEDFRRSMVEIYRNLARHMPDDGLQLVMFTHQDPAVWADLGMILWAAGLKATAAWTIATETDAVGIKKGNYVQGTVCLVLRKRMGHEPGFLDEVFPMVEDEVHRQIDAMRALDEGGEPNFNDADYQLAAYAAALKVLTQYATLDGRDVEHELFAARDRREASDFQRVIERAITIACDYLIPRGLDGVWRELDLAERYYLRALDIESRGERRKGMYEELARGFNLSDIRPLLLSDKANGARMRTPASFGNATLSSPGPEHATAGLPARRGRIAAAGPHPFASTALRHLLFAVRETTRHHADPGPGRQYLRDTFGQQYWSLRERCIALLDWLAAIGNSAGMSEWTEDSTAARLLAGRLRNDHA